MSAWPTVSMNLYPVLLLKDNCKNSAFSLSLHVLKNMFHVSTSTGVVLSTQIRQRAANSGALYKSDNEQL